MEERTGSWRPILGRPRRESPQEIELNNFSFIHDPVRTIESFRQICEAEATELEVRINFNDEACLDVGAFLVVGI